MPLSIKLQQILQPDLSEVVSTPLITVGGGVENLSLMLNGRSSQLMT